ncbi:centrosomal protein of 290 kDa-like, partial [Vespula maculifrons]
MHYFLSWSLAAFSSSCRPRRVIPGGRDPGCPIYRVLGKYEKSGGGREVEVEVVVAMVVVVVVVAEAAEAAEAAAATAVRPETKCRSSKLSAKFRVQSQNALDEECRAKKALNLLEARDRRIAFLERRVAELEETAIGMHTMSLRASSTLSSLDDPTNKDAYYSITQSEQSIKLENDYKNLDSSSNEHDQAYDQSQRFSMNQTMVPNLKLSSSTSYTDKEIFSTPALDMTYQKISNYLYVGSSDISTNYEMKSRSISETIRDYGNEKSPIEDNRSTFVSNIDIEKRSKKKDELKFHSQKNEEITYMLPKSRNCNTGFPSRVSSSVAWIRTKRNFRKKIRPFATRVKRQQKGDQRAEKIDVSSF